MVKPQYVKVLFRYFSKILDKHINENMWAIVIEPYEGIFKLDNIPFYGAPIASDDVFKAVFDDREGAYIFQKIIEPSGNSVIFIATLEGTDKQLFRDAFKSIGCTSEGLNQREFTMEIPKQVDYQLVKQKLDSFEEKDMIYYIESYISDKHQSDVN